LLGDPLEALTDTTWTNLSGFSAHGGKLLFYHGMSDQAFSLMDTLDYYQRTVKANGGMDQVQNWSRMVSSARHVSLPWRRVRTRQFRPSDRRGQSGGEGHRSKFRGRKWESFPRPEPAIVRISQVRTLQGPRRPGRSEEFRVPRMKSAMAKAL
jgi:Tannase and feruloyl esterase